MARSDTWMPLYWGDYLRDTGHLDVTEHGAYLLLIGHYWTTGKPLPDDDGRLSKIVRASPAQWKKLRPAMVDFFDVLGGEWRHGRIDAELARAIRVSDARQEAGKRGGKASAKRKQLLEQLVERTSTHAGAQPSQPPSPLPEDNNPPLPTEAPPPKPKAAIEISVSVAEPESPQTALVAEQPVENSMEVPLVLDRTAPAMAVWAWNAMADRCGLATVQRLTTERRMKVRARLAECGGLDGFNAALAKVEASPFLLGQNDRGWRADFDFVVKPKSFTKLMEGAYDRPANGGPAPTTLDRVMAAMQEPSQ